MASKCQEQAIDMTPMIDIVFQLIIFFIVTVNLDQQSVMEQITLPQAPHSKEESRRDPRQVTIQVDKKGQFFIGTQRYDLKQLKIVMTNARKAAGGAENLPVLIRGDVASAHKYIRKVMDACSELGIYKIRFAAMKQAGKQKAGG